MSEGTSARLAAVERHRFEVLDALRGVAAIAVIDFHFVSAFGGFRFFPRGYLSVDFFFALSGFVLSHAHQTKLERGQSFRQFMTLRFLRLYPLYLVGLFAGIALMFHHPSLVHWDRTTRLIFIGAALNLFLCRSPPILSC